MLVALYALSIDYQIIHAQRHSKGQYRETILQIAAVAGRDDLLYVRSEYHLFSGAILFRRRAGIPGRERL